MIEGGATFKTFHDRRKKHSHNEKMNIFECFEFQKEIIFLKIYQPQFVVHVLSVTFLRSRNASVQLTRTIMFPNPHVHFVEQWIKRFCDLLSPPEVLTQMR